MTDQNDIIEAAARVLDPLRTMTSELRRLVDAGDLQRLREAITHERALRAGVVALLRKIEWRAISWRDDPCCPSCGSHWEGGLNEPRTENERHRDGCSLSALLARLDPKEGA